MLTTAQAFIIIALLSAGTAITRFLPFLLFRDAARAPRYVHYLGRQLPPAAISLLLIYCLRYVSLTSAPHGIPEAISIFVVAALHIWKKNTLISITAGTACYMLLVQFLF